ncbi:MAG: Lysine--tRNA ligase [Holosporales bacterium]
MLENEHELSRLKKLEAIRKEGINPFPSKVKRTHSNSAVLSAYADLQNGESTTDIVSVVGRVMSIRNSGMFIDLYDQSGKIQIYSDIKNHADSVIVENLDIGDFIEVTGTVRRTPRGELSVNSSAVRMLAKAMLPLPEKHHGLVDVETRYRQRYVDLISNEKSKETLLNRFLVISHFRTVLNSLGFLEVETPMLHPIAGGAIAKPFVTHHNTLDISLFLRIAPELYLKRLIVGGLSEKIYEINRCFRNEGISTRHNPEFTSLELYQAYADYTDMIDIAEHLIKDTCKRIHNNESVMFNGKEIAFDKPFERKSMVQLVFEKTGIDFMQIHDVDQARGKAKELGIKLKGNEPWGKVVEIIFGEVVEKDLIQPIHVTDLPTDISPLAKQKEDEPRLTERFETYINGWEIANGFSELNDPAVQYDRFLAQVESKEAGDDEAHDMDHDFINALKHAMPPTGGLGIGLDRLAMILTDAQSIREVIAFPTLKNLNAS